MEKSRRKFIKNTAAASSATFLAPSIVSASVFGANDRINAAVLGVNGRGKSHISSLMKQKNVQVTTLCDPDMNIMQQRQADFKNKYDKNVSLEQDLRRVMDYYNVEKAHLLGLSMGGRIAFSFCEKYSHRIASLILCDTHKGFQHFSKEQQEDFIRLRKEPLLSGKEPEDIAPVVAKTLIGLPENKQTFDALVDSMSRLHKDSYIKSIEASVRGDHADVLHKIKVPTLVVVGEFDRLTPPELAKDIANQIAGAKLEIIKNAGPAIPENS